MPVRTTTRQDGVDRDVVEGTVQLAISSAVIALSLSGRFSVMSRTPSRGVETSTGSIPGR